MISKSKEREKQSISFKSQFITNLCSIIFFSLKLEMSRLSIQSDWDGKFVFPDKEKQQNGEISKCMKVIMSFNDVWKYGFQILWEMNIQAVLCIFVEHT